MYGGGESSAQGSGSGDLRERDHWGDPDADGRIILRWIFKKWEGVVDSASCVCEEENSE